jgi:lipopolysaccharide export system permease protein
MIPDRLDRHVARAVLRSSLLVGLVFLALDWLLAFLDQVDDRRGDYGLLAVCEYILLTTPRRLWEVVPYVALLGALAGLSLLGSRGELVVMRAAGRRPERITAAALLPALLLVVVGGWLGEIIGPGAEARAQARKAIARGGGALQVRGGSWYREESGDGVLVTHAARVRADGSLIGVTQYGLDPGGVLHRVRRAERAVPTGGGDDPVRQHWWLESVTLLELTDERVRRSSHARLPWTSRAGPDRFRLQSLVAPERMALPDLLQRLRAGAEEPRLRLALWRKASQPLAVIALVLVGAAFVFGPLREQGMGARLAAGIATGLLFRQAQDLLAPASLVFGFPPLVAVLVPVIGIAVAGLVMLRRAG